MSKLPIPYDLEAEQAVIGAFLLWPVKEKLETVLSFLKPEHFYVFAHQHIFAEMLRLINHNQPIDIITLNNRLKEVGKLEQTGGFAYLAEMANLAPSSFEIVSYARIVHDEAIRRFASHKIKECQEVLLQPDKTNIQQRLDKVSRLVTEITDYERCGRFKGLKAGEEIASEWAKDWDLRLHHPEQIKGLSTGIEALDKLLGAKKMLRQSLAVVGARPKVGKTALLTTFATNCIINEHKTVLLFSLEMSAKAIFERMFTQLGNISPAVFYENEEFLRKQGIATEYERTKGFQAIDKLIKEDLLYIDDSPSVGIAHIRNECRRLKRKKGEIGLIAVDYLTLMQAEKAERNDLAYGKITRELKALAREMDCVVLLLTQLNRSLENRADKRPQPSDGRDTGQIEQDCDYWIGLYRESVYNQSADKELTEILLQLNRHGKTGKVYCEQRNGAIFNLDQIEGERRAERAENKNQPLLQKVSGFKYP